MTDYEQGNVIIVPSNNVLPPMKASRFRPFVWPGIRYLLIFLLGIATGLGIVALILKNMGVIGGEVDNNNFAQVEIDLGLLPMPTITSHFTTIDLSFSQVPSAAVFSPTKLVISTMVPGADWVVAGNTTYQELNEMVFIMKDLSPSSQVHFKYQVEFENTKLSAASNVVVVYTNDPVPPPTPALSKRSATTSEIRYQIAPISDALSLCGAEITSYTVEMIRNGEVSRVIIPVPDASLDESGLADFFSQSVAISEPRGLVRLRVAAENSIGLGHFSDQMEFRSDSADRVVPTSPLGVIGTPKATLIRLSWDRDTTDYGSDITHYLISMESDSMPVPTLSRVSGELDSFTIPNLIPETKYSISVSAVNSAGSSLPSTIAVETMSDVECLPDAPININANFRWLDGRLVSWSFPSEPECPVKLIGSRVVDADDKDRILCTSNGASCDLKGMTSGQTISVKVQSENSNGWGDFSDASPITVPVLTSPFQGLCGSRSDNRYFLNTGSYNAQTFTGHISSCAKKKKGIADKSALCIQRESAKTKPFDDMSELSDGCASCFGAAVSCGALGCSSECGFGNAIYSDECLSCNESKCGEALRQCAAIDRPFASSQMPPSPRP